MTSELARNTMEHKTSKTLLYYIVHQNAAGLA